jgi:TonB-linked outer membrane protein, SusC/RagA family
MKLTLLLTVLTLVNAAGSVYSQSKGLTLSLKNATLQEVFNKIEDQSKFKFFYQNEQIDVNRLVSVNVEGAKVEDLLDKLFANANVKYRVLEDNLVLLTADKLQQNKVTGTVVSAKDGQPLPGVSVQEKGTTNGAMTDVNGKFSIIVQGSSSVLVFSFIGYLSDEKEVGSQTVINVTLNEDIKQLDEVVVIGYGQQKKSLVTGAISSVKASDIKGASIQRAEQVLQGKTAGVQVIPNSGSPGAGMNIRVRGYSSNANANPIFVVDGVKTNDIGYLDPNDISSMEVLKDGASSAIYGSEGGNGVVMITTKSGQAGKSQVTYDFQYAFQSVGKLPKLMNVDQYAQYMSETTPALTVDKTYNTDWLKEIFETGSLVKHHIQFSGGNDKSTYLMSISYLSNDGIIKGSQDKFKRYTIRLNGDHKMTSWLKVGNNLSYANTTRDAINENGGEFGGVIGSALQIDPSTPVEFTGAIPSSIQSIIDKNPTVLKAPDGKYYGISQYNFGEIVNPFVTMAITNGGVKQDNINGNVYAEITPLKGLTFTSRFGLDLFYQNNHFWNPVYYYTTERSNTATLVVDNNFKNFGWTWENFITYTKKFGEHNVTVLAGMSAEDIVQKTNNAQGGPMVVATPSFAELGYIASQATDQIGGNSPEFRKESFFGRLTYDYKNKYLLQGSIRRDGASSSYVPKDGRWGVFPSFSAGWVMSNEEFFPKTAVSYLKLRGSWGQNGSLSNLITNPYGYLGAITGSNNGLIMQYPFSSGNVTVLEPANTPNPNLTWETSQQTDIGIDLKTLNDKLTFSVDYYNKKTKDLIATPTYPYEVGNAAPPINAGDVENRGFEFDLGYNNNAGDFKYSINLNLSTLKNKVTYLDPQVGRLIGSQVGTGWNATSCVVGQPIWYFYGYKTAGIDPATGSPRFVKADGTVTNAAGVSANDMQNIGSAIPKVIYGGSINLAYKGIDLAINVSGMGGNKVMMGWIRKDRNRVNRPTYFYDGRWTTPGQAASKPGANADPLTWNSDQIVFNGSFLRIQQLQLGYTLPTSLIKQIKMNSLRVYVSLDNFFTFTSYPGMDPQASPQNNNPNSVGIDRGTYPIPRSIMFGASVSF